MVFPGHGYVLPVRRDLGVLFLTYPTHRRCFLLSTIHHYCFASFILYILGFVTFVGTLKQGCYKDQFSQFAWAHLALFLTVIPAHFAIKTVLEGLIWFLVPIMLAVVNDVFAYLCGKTFDRTQIIQLSTKKTVEGFLGAKVFTIAFGYFFTSFLMEHTYFSCPFYDFTADCWIGLTCKISLAFAPR